jgi:hypothetical protein
MESKFIPSASSAHLRCQRVLCYLSICSFSTTDFCASKAEGRFTARATSTHKKIGARFPMRRSVTFVPNLALLPLRSGNFPLTENPSIAIARSILRIAPVLPLDKAYSA